MSKTQTIIDQTLGFVGVTVLLPFTLLNRQKPLAKNPRILVIKNKAIGDSIYILPALRELHQKLGARIDVICDSTNQDVFKNQNFVINIILLKLKNIPKIIKKYDLVIDAEPWSNISAILAFMAGKQTIGFSNQFRSKLYTHQITYSKQQHIVQTYLDFVRIFTKNPSDALVPLHYSKQAQQNVAKKINADKIIGIGIGVSANAKTRMWPKERWVELIQKINKEFPQYTVVLFGIKEDYEQAQHIATKTKAKNLHGKTSKEEFFAGIKMCELFISVDSGQLHVAATQGVNSIGLFGPNTPVIWGPYGKNNTSFFHPNPGVPSIDNTKAFFNKPTEYERKAMNDITVKEVFNTVKKYLKNKE